MTQTSSGDPADIAMLRDSAAAFVARGVDLKRLRAWRRRVPGYDPELRKQMTDAGWFGLLVPEESGGFGGGFAGMAAVLEELGAGLAAEPLLALGVPGTRVLVHSQPSPLRTDLLARCVSGDALPALAWQEQAVGFDPAAISLRAQSAGGSVELRGRKRFVAGAAEAHGFVVSATTADGIGLYWVPRDMANLRIEYEWRADGSALGLLDFAGVRIDRDQTLAAPSAGLEPLARALDETLVMVSAEMLGVMRGALGRTLNYLRTRVQFGKPIGSFQALQHRVVDHFIQQRLTEAALAHALSALSALQSECGLAASRVKCRSNDAGMRITREAIQLHGAIGFTDDCDIGLYLKRALALSTWLGQSSEHRERCAALLSGRFASATDCPMTPPQL